MAYIGNTSIAQAFSPAVDYFSGNASTTSFTLSRPVASVAEVQVVVANVIQNPSSAYSVTGNTITFTSAPPTGSNNIYVYYTSPVTQVIAPGQGTVTATSLAANIAIAAGSLSVAGNNISAVNSLGFRNRLINGDMRIDQRNAGASFANPNAYQYSVDRWKCYGSVASKYTVQQNAGSITPPAGFTNYLGFTSSSAYAVGATEQFFFSQLIEGYNVADLAWGTANAKPVTLSFLVYSSLTGTFGGLLYNSGGSRNYPFTYTISAANTWTQIFVTIPGDTSGTWLTNSNTGIAVQFNLGIGSTYTGAGNAWTGSAIFNPTGAVSIVGTSGATFYITGVQLEAGSVATPFERRPYGMELALCQRYYQATTMNLRMPQQDTGGGRANSFLFPVTMRAAPTTTLGSPITAWSSGPTVTASAMGVEVSGSVASSGTGQWVAGYNANAEL